MSDPMAIPRKTGAETLAKLEMGAHVPLESIGWDDWQASRCPDCGHQVLTTAGVPFHFGPTSAYLHQCGPAPEKWASSAPNTFHVSELFEDPHVWAEYCDQMRHRP